MNLRTSILQDERTATGVLVPDEVVTELGAGKRPPVRVTIDGHTYRSSIASMGGQFMISLSSEYRRLAGVQGGDTVDVVVEIDDQPRTVEVPPDLAAALQAEPPVAAESAALTYSTGRRLVGGRQRDVGWARAAASTLPQRPRGGLTGAHGGGRSVRRAGTVLTVVGLVIWLAACGRPAEDPGGEAAGPVTTISRGIGTIGVDVSGIAPGDDPAVLVATAADVPVGDGSCAVEIQPVLQYEDDRVYVTLLYELDQTEVYEVVEQGYKPLHAETAVDGCERGSRPVEIGLDGPLAGRVVITQSPTALWQRGPDGTYARCELPACDPSTGQPPAPPACGDATLPDAVRRGDVPRRAYIDVRACELPWAVVDIDTGAGACPATGEPNNPCAGKQIDRSYWKVVDGRWDVLAYSFGPGCGAVRDVLPDLPEHLCADLPPVP